MVELGNVLILTSDEDFRWQATRGPVGRECRAKVLRESGEAVLSVLEDDIDVVVLDADGKELKSLITTVRIIEKCRPRIPVVLVTSNKSILNGAEILKENIFYFVIKPANPEELGEVVFRAIKKKHHLEKI